MTGEEFCIFSKHLPFNLNFAQTLSLSNRGKLKSPFSNFLSCFLISLKVSSVHWSQIMSNNCVFTDRIKPSLLLILSKNHFIVENKTRLESLGDRTAGQLYKRDPVGIIIRVEMARHQEEDVHDPPDAEAAEGEKLADPGAGEAETEPVQAQEAEEDAVEEGRHEVVVGVADAGKSSPEEDSGSGALDTVENSTAGLGLLHLLPPLASVPEAAVSLVVGRLVTAVVHRLLALQELAGQETAGNQRRLQTFLQIQTRSGQSRHDWRSRGHLHCGQVGTGVAVRIPVVAGTVTELPNIILSGELSVFYRALLSFTAGHCQDEHCQYCQHAHSPHPHHWLLGWTPAPDDSWLTLYAYSRVLDTALISFSIDLAQLSTSPTSFRLLLKLSIRVSQEAVCLEKLLAFRCNCLASESSLFWLR